MMFLGTNVRDSRRLEALAGYCVPAKTGTGMCPVTYNAENRPVRWQSGDTVITMAFDRMGRRVEMRTVKDGAATLQRFVYDNYLCVQQLRGPDNSLYHSYIWDPTEPIATRPLVFLPASGEIAYYFHDGNKNVVDLVALSKNNIHYRYTPFGIVSRQINFVSHYCKTLKENPFAYASEYYNASLDLIHYNYRDYDFTNGVWGGRDPLGERGGNNLYMYCFSRPVDKFDFLGMDVWVENTTSVNGFHRRVCVDKWVKSAKGKCCNNGSTYIKSGKYCISFGVISNDSDVFDSFSGDGGMSDSDSSGNATISGDEVGFHQGGATFPPGFDGPNSEGDGMAYVDDRDPATKEVKRLNTDNSCQFDLSAFN